VVIYVAGEVNAISAAEAESKPKAVKLGQSLNDGDRLKTGANGRASLVFTDGSQMKLNYNTDMMLRSKDINGEKNVRGINSVKLFIGSLWSRITHNPKATFEIETSSAVAAVKGSSGTVDEDGQDTTCIHWVDGKVKVFNPFGSSSITDQEELCVHKGEAPPKAHKYTPSGHGWQDEVKQGSAGGTLKVKLSGEGGASEEVDIDLSK
jgi:hypothetical protein